MAKAPVAPPSKGDLPTIGEEADVGALIASTKQRLIFEKDRVAATSKVYLVLGIVATLVALSVFFLLTLGVQTSKIPVSGEVSRLQEVRKELLMFQTNCVNLTGNYIGKPANCEGVAKELKENRAQIDAELAKTSTGSDLFPVFELKTLITNIVITGLIQFIGIFFFRLYVNSERVLRFYVNEITNLEYRYIGVVLCLSGAEVADKFRIASAFLFAERNFILSKGERSALPEDGAGEEPLLERVAAILHVLGIASRPATSGARN